METIYPPDADEPFASIEEYSKLFDDLDDFSDEPTAEPTQAQLLEANVEIFAHASAIPFQNRLRYLVGEEEQANRTGYRYTDADELASRLQLTLDELIAIISELNVPAEMTPTDQFDNVTIAPGADLIIVEEVKWRKKYSELQDDVSTTQIAEIFGIGYLMADRILRSTRIQPRDIEHGNAAFTGHYYPKSLLPRIRAEIMMFPPARQNKTLRRMIGEIGCGKKWGANHVGTDFAPDLMRSSQGKVEEYYPPKLQQHLRQQFEALPNAEKHMYTVAQLADELGRDDEWIRLRLNKLQMDGQSLFRNGKMPTLYDSETYELLHDESERQKRIPALRDNEASLDELIERLDTTHETAGRILKELGVASFERLHPYSGAVMPAYNTDIRPTLAQAIVRDRERRLAEHRATATELSSRPRETLTDDERKRLITAQQQVGIMAKHLARAQAAYERLMNDPAAERGDISD